MARKPSYRIRLAAKEGSTPPDVYRAVEALDRECFPDDSPALPADNHWWLAYSGNAVAGFCGVQTNNRPYPFLSRLAVAKAHRGANLGQRMVVAAIAYGRRAGWSEIRTYVASDNLPSANTMIACGFRLYSFGEAAPGWLYFRLSL